MLLRLNKQDQIEALKSIGFTTVNENTPASDIAKYMQWSGTLLDLSLGYASELKTVNKSFSRLPNGTP